MLPMLSKTIFGKPSFYANVRKTITQANSLSPLCYYNNEYHIAENEFLWKKNWFGACFSQEMLEKGSTKVIDVGNQSYIITRDRNNKLHAFNNVCIHRGAKLCSKDGIKKNMSCPYHFWTFGLDGTLKATPNLEKTDDIHKNQIGNKRTPKLNEIHIEEYGSIIWLNSTLKDSNNNGKTNNLPEHLDHPKKAFGEFSDKFQNYGLFDENVTDVYEMKGSKIWEKMACNWKLKMENFAEWYHLPAVHPQIVETCRPDMHYIENGYGNYVSYFTDPISETPGSAMAVSLFNRINANLNEQEKRSIATIVLPPNIQICLFPHFIWAMIIHPTKDYNYSKESLCLLMNRDSKLENDSNNEYETKCQNLFDDLVLVNNQDIDICENVQNGVQSNNYEGGIFSNEQETCVYRFQNFIADYMTGDFGKHLHGPVARH